MKKIIALLLLLTMAISMTATALATGQQTGTTTLTAVVPEPSYTIHIPANTTLVYGNTEKQAIGDVYVTDAVNVDGSIVVQSPYTDLKNSSNTEDTIALSLSTDSFEITQAGLTNPGNGLVTIYNKTQAGQYRYDENGYARYAFYAKVNDWSGATAGATYQATITWNFSIHS